jgi:adiponectin receptor
MDDVSLAPLPCAGHWVCVAAHADVALLLPGVLTMFACYALGVFFFVTHLPERLAPGRFDSGFSSHPLWHVCILAGMWSWDATLRQMIYREWTCEGESS